MTYNNSHAQVQNITKIRLNCADFFATAYILLTPEKATAINLSSAKQLKSKWIENITSTHSINPISFEQWIKKYGDKSSLGVIRIILKSNRYKTALKALHISLDN